VGSSFAFPKASHEPLWRKTLVIEAQTQAIGFCSSDLESHCSRIVFLKLCWMKPPTVQRFMNGSSASWATNIYPIPVTGGGAS
jgi:hypothetical protein